MSDGQTETNEMIAAQNAAVSVRLERGESVRWHDGEQWQTGVALRGPFNTLFAFAGKYVRLVQTCDGIYVVSPDALEPYPQRCEECGGSGYIIDPPLVPSNDSVRYVSCKSIKCPSCGGSGRRKA